MKNDQKGTWDGEEWIPQTPLFSSLPSQPCYRPRTLLELDLLRSNKDLNKIYFSLKQYWNSHEPENTDQTPKLFKKYKNCHAPCLCNSWTHFFALTNDSCSQNTTYWTRHILREIFLLHSRHIMKYLCFRKNEKRKTSCRQQINLEWQH